MGAGQGAIRYDIENGQIKVDPKLRFSLDLFVW